MTNKANDQYDVIVIGSGAGGSAAAWALCQAGARVLILESGPRYMPAEDYPLTDAAWELKRFPHKTQYRSRYGFPYLQELEAKWDHLRSWNHLHGQTNRASKRRFGGYQHVRGVGGSTLHFSGQAHRLHPKAMRLRTDHGVGADWPLTYDELEPFYYAAEKIVGVAGPRRSGARRRSQPYPLPAHSLSYASRQIAHGCKKLGLGWEAEPLAILSRGYDGRPPCNYCANCNRGCPRGDKGSADVTFVAKALASGRCVLRSDTTVLSLEIGANDQVSAIRYVDDKGHENRLTARVVVLACGAVETPRVLLASRQPRVPEGVANDSGQVGRNFMELVSISMSGLHDKPLGSQRGVATGGICWDFSAPDGIPGVVGGCTLSLSVGESNFLGPVNYAWRVVPGWGRSHKQAMRETFGRVLSVSAHGESIPNENGYIDLDPEQQDKHGVPIARIHSYMDDMTLRRLDFMQARVKDVLSASGVQQFIEQTSTYDIFHSSHVFGTCRMGDDARTSVVDRYGRSHRHRNLFVLDASVFPSSGSGEAPSLSIQALAIRGARHLLELMVRKEI